MKSCPRVENGNSIRSGQLERARVDVAGESKSESFQEIATTKDSLAANGAVGPQYIESRPVGEFTPSSQLERAGSFTYLPFSALGEHGDYTFSSRLEKRVARDFEESIRKIADGKDGFDIKEAVCIRSIQLAPERGDDICSCQFQLAGEEVAGCFDPSVQEIADAFKKQRRAATVPIKHVFLVGGYAASDFLYQRIQKHPAFAGVRLLCRPGSHLNKAVADGAVSFYIDHLVTSRAAKFTYGVGCDRYYNSNLSDHRKRSQTQYIGPSGRIMIPNGFASILLKGTQASEQQEFRQVLVMEEYSRSEFTTIEESFLAYRGSLLEPTWMDKEPASFTKLCTVIADTSRLVNSMRPQRSLNGGTYYSLNIDVILLFGLTELKAQIGWKDRGVEMRSPASIMYDEYDD
ncbi:hypothetical protein BU15DRAFT_81774 [Melanogaster broomeanus]|nr:hypothetical protein BU15DRAFT_81774 [Melanogaster broomeanus]